MSYSFENVVIDNNIRTLSVFHVSKMPDQFLEVEFKYTKCPVWRGCIPIFEKYQGIDYTKASYEDIVEWIRCCYQEMDPGNARAWSLSEKEYWQSHESANKAKPLFDVLNSENRYHLTEWGCRQCTDTSKVNSQAASRIRALKKDHGYHIASKESFCEVCQENTTHDLLIRIKRIKGISNKRYSLPGSLVKRIKKLFEYTDACFGDAYSEDSRALIVDHKFPSTRWAAGESPNFAAMTDEEIRKKFQLLTQQTNLWKERICFRCLNEKKRGDFFGVRWYPQGDEVWRGENGSDERGCVGCPWYDLKEWKRLFNQYLEEQKKNNS